MGLVDQGEATEPEHLTHLNMTLSLQIGPSGLYFLCLAAREVSLAPGMKTGAGKGGYSQGTAAL